MALVSQHQGAPRLDTLPPELQQEIFGYLDGDNASLFAAIQVSKTCHNFCLGMLWRISTQKRLAKALTLDRRQYYADMIHDWDLDDDLSRDLFDGLEFPLLKGFSFSGGSLSDMQLRRCLQSGLYTLRYIKCEVDTAIMKLPAAYCMQLQEFEMIYTSTRNVTPPQFMLFLQSLLALRRLHLHKIAENIMDEVIRWKSSFLAQLEELTLTEYRESERSIDPHPGFRNNFLKHCMSLRKLYVDCGDWISADTLTHLSRLTSLEVLHIHEWLELANEEFQTLSHHADSGSCPFPNMKDLSLCGRTCVITTLLFNTPETLLDLDLTVVEADEGDNHDKILQVVGCLSNLVRLSLLFDFGSEISRTDMDHISRLSKLQKCHIERRDAMLPEMGREPDSSEYSWLTDHYFKSWTAKLPQLRDLRLALERSTMYPLGPSSLQSLADNCPLLTKCQLMWIHDLDTWMCLEGPMFPNLKVLLLRGVTNYGYAEDDEDINARALSDSFMIRDLAPNLKDFGIEYGRVRAGLLLDAFKSTIDVFVRDFR